MNTKNPADSSNRILESAGLFYKDEIWNIILKHVVTSL